MIFNRDIAGLMDIDLGDSPLAACPDVMYVVCRDIPGTIHNEWNTRLGFNKEIDYFNSGLLVYNMPVWRVEGIKEKLMTRLADGQEPLWLPDQDAINLVIGHRIKRLDLSWNVTIFQQWLENVFADWRRSFKPGKLTDLTPKAKAIMDEYLTAYNTDKKVVHYTGSDKPWNFADMELAYLFWHYAARTPAYLRLLQRLFRFRNGDVAKVDQEYRFLFIPLMKVTGTKLDRRYKLLGMKIARKIRSKTRIRWYIFGVNAFTVKDYSTP